MRKYLLIMVLVIVIIGMSAFTWTLPEIEVPETSVVYDINNRPVRGLAEQNRISLSFNEIPPVFIQAIIAVEDKNFYKHHGIDISGILRAVFINIKERKIVAGGSTITQQTAKNLFLTNERTFARKLKEFYYAIQLERYYSKDEILTMYCNTIYFGQGAYGIEVAARTFFAKSANELSLAEAALLAGLPRWPTYYNPYINPDIAKERQAVVLQRMVEEGFIDKKDKEQALKKELIFEKSADIKGEAPYFIAMVKDYVSEKYGESMLYQGGLHIYTTLDLDMQKAANNAYQQGLDGKQKQLQAALVAVDVTNGHIRALIGGKDYSASSFNRVYARRQPGSTFKPFMYSLAMDSGYTAADMLMCEEVEYELPNGDIYRPTDYGNKPYHWRNFTLHEAVMKSDNVVAVRLNSILNPNATARHTEKFGFKNIKPILSLPLGSIEVTPLEMASAYAVFANRGVYSEPVYILRIEDKNGNILEQNRVKQKKVVEPENAFLINNMLEGVLEPGGTGYHLRNIISGPAAGKTGTTDEFRDAWFVGYTPRLCCAVWVGFDNGNSIYSPGGVLAGPIWAQFMAQASAKLGKEDFIRPDNIKILNICLDTGLIATEFCPRSAEMAFIKGSEPEDICYHHMFESEWNWHIDESTWGQTP